MKIITKTKNNYSLLVILLTLIGLSGTTSSYYVLNNNIALSSTRDRRNIDDVKKSTSDNDITPKLNNGFGDLLVQVSLVSDNNEFILPIYKKIEIKTFAKYLYLLTGKEKVDKIKVNVNNMLSSKKVSNDYKKFLRENVVPILKTYDTKYKHLLYSWYASEPILEKYLMGENVPNISIDYHLNQLKHNLQFVNMLANEISSLKI